MFISRVVTKVRRAVHKVIHDRLKRLDNVHNAESVSIEEYWSNQNVTHHRHFENAEKSLAYFHWRNNNYYGYINLMPVSGQDGKVVVDYGCGPGNDIVGFATQSKPARLIGMDISQPSLKEASTRLALHGRTAEFIKLSDSSPIIPLPDQSVDHVHCSGVLMYVADDLATLKEFRRVLRPGGSARVMVYNYDSVWFHLFAGYVQRFTNPVYRGKTAKEAFFESTDWLSCPMNRVWRVKEFISFCEKAGFDCTHSGNAVAVREVEYLPMRFEAILAEKLEEEHRRFLLGLTFDNRGLPYFEDQVAGIDGCYLLRPN
jgi:ubiquinone/menaquinone biosynthesis C-methylase UbiE